MEIRLEDLLAVVMAMYSMFGEDCYAHHSEETQLKVISHHSVLHCSFFIRHCWSILFLNKGNVIKCCCSNWTCVSHVCSTFSTSLAFQLSTLTGEISARKDIDQSLEEIFIVLNRLIESRNYLNQFKYCCCLQFFCCLYFSSERHSRWMKIPTDLFSSR